MRHSISCTVVSKHSGFDRVGWGGIPLKPKPFGLGSRHVTITSASGPTVSILLMVVVSSIVLVSV
jgi:hypothetical protein